MGEWIKNGKEWKAGAFGPKTRDFFIGNGKMSSKGGGGATPNGKYFIFSIVVIKIKTCSSEFYKMPGVQFDPGAVLDKVTHIIK